MFELNPILSRDSVLVGEFPLCQLRLINDSQFPWFILVPKRSEVTEAYQLNEEDRSQLMAESCLLSEVLHDAFAADKLNVAAIGNLVPQLHLHHVVRYCNDACWPAPIWGKLTPIPYSEMDLAKILQRIQLLLGDDLT
ncbi:HIT domain-containing protein [Marinomonas algarum]|uniref:HIT domain-containing protein n=1 Tax=Marinomonas algarum TaxID=2883105 RepID=A0A9X1ILG8_9GAMM|nr:HIT domain-containing protein [Marinomonas algarum]MCB5161430.1 HIT domain-containing protein [Marinomonas algarum]